MEIDSTVPLKPSVSIKGKSYVLAILCLRKLSVCASFVGELDTDDCYAFSLVDACLASDHVLRLKNVVATNPLPMEVVVEHRSMVGGEGQVAGASP